MSFRRLVLPAAALGTAVLVAACGSGGPAATTSVVPAASTPAETPLEVPTFDLGTLALPSLVIPSFASDGELEAQLPDEIGGQIVVKRSVTGEGIFSLGLAASGSIDKLLDEVDASIDDVSVAIGLAGTSVIVLAYQVHGVSADRVFDGFLTALPSGGVQTQRTVAGRSVTEVSATGETTYIYLADDVLFIIGGTLTPELLEDAVSQLPAA